ncbi:glutamate synthase large subunit [Haliovirga abyssi]|uniref:Glutamate synthase n=1 Tax=Haliovirga abyssi TaxID=2996794 RepID=A0AAU9D1F3_9FUSO|nr:glutamate synthase large subunit [Haliovirga abyssi]BDU49811.1 glutamate synthase [Haliovirga abyssi]
MARGMGIPEQQGLYSPQMEKDNCGVGFVAHIKGKKSHEIVEKGIEVLVKLTHRGAVGADPETGDGAGLLIQMPDKFFRSEIENLPKEGEYGVGFIFLPVKYDEQLIAEGIIEKVIEDEGQEIISWRNVPVESDKIGVTAASTMPGIKQLFIKKSEDVENFELKLYIIRKKIEKAIMESNIKNKDYFYIPSMSSRVIVYKGLLLAGQIKAFYPELGDEKVTSSLALVHQRYSTNTFPSWDLSQPFRYLAHNGEINTIKGNANWMSAREPELYNEILGDNIKELYPICNLEHSDSANLDHAFELLIASGKSIVEAATLLVPAAWENDVELPQNVKDYYEYNSGLVEPWDGPAAIAFTDGKQIGATLDRNGLRPARYIVTKDDLVIMASEVGVLEIDPKNIKQNGRLMPGKMFLVDMEEGRIVSDEELKDSIAKNESYGEWLKNNKKNISELSEAAARHENDYETIVARMKAFGYTREDLKEIIVPMAKNGKEPIGSMGNDASLAVLSDKSKLLFNYFKQLFAQVTNPPIDPIREKVVMSLTTNIGVKGNILEETEEKAKLITLESPILTDKELDKIVHLKDENFKTKVIPALFNISEEDGLEKGLELLFAEAEKSIDEGYNILVISDRKVDDFNAPIPSLLATAGLHHYLIKKRKRNGVDIIVETGEAREVMHFALLIGYGALAVNPYIAYEAIDYMIDTKLYLTENAKAKKEAKYIKAVDKGLLKIMSKMGISTIQSYRGAQIFEALGLSTELVDKYFTGTVSRIEGIGLDIIEKETLERHKKAFNSLRKNEFDILENDGEYHYRKNGEKHLFGPEAVAKLQHSTRLNNYDEYKEYAKLINDQSENLATIRGLIKFKKRNSISIDEVEPVENIMKRFVTGAMSYGSISKEAHEAMAIAMNAIGGKSNSGEGGEDPERFLDNRRSSIKQIASGRFGVTTHYLVNADELQIKMAQGAKPGEGGHLPGHKVSEEIAKVRHTSPGIDLISPPPHHDIYSIEDLAQLIFDLKNVNPDSRVSVKLVSEIGIGTIAAGVSKAHADMILVSGYDGGTGAAPLTSMKHTGLPWELGVSETHQVLSMNDLRGRVRLQADGQMKTGRDIAIATLLGAEEYGFATGALVVLGCVMMRSCHTNTCPVGVATQNPELRKRFLGKSEYLINYFTFVAREVREIMAELGFKSIDEMVGKTEVLELDEAIKHWKSKGLDLTKILYQPQLPKKIAKKCVQSQDHGIDSIADRRLIELAKPALENREKVEINVDIHNTDRTFGTMLSGAVAKKYGEFGLDDDTIKINIKGYAGQSFGTFGMKGITLNLEGQANDYIGKGLFGAKIIVKAPETADFDTAKNIIGGNTILYGAIKGEAYFNGVVGERFCVRNSGVTAVVEGIGDHGCEYMTGGRVAVLGGTGKNFGAGMSGGIAYVYDITGEFDKKVNMLDVEIDKVETEKEKEELKTMIENHLKYTNSNRAKDILQDWGNNINKFVKVIAPGYKKLLAEGKVK